MDSVEHLEDFQLGRDVYFRTAVLAVVLRWTAEEHEMVSGKVGGC